MANSLLIKRGLETNRTGITPSEGEPLYITDSKDLYIGDGVTAGGIYVGGSSGASVSGLINNSDATWLTVGSNEWCTFSAGIVTEGFESNGIQDTASATKLTINDGGTTISNNLTVTNGGGAAQIYVGNTDLAAGELVLAGAGTGSTIGGALVIENAADHDATVNRYAIRSSSANLNFDSLAPGDTSTTRLTIESNGTLNVAGTTSYETLVTADDDIPNKKYVDDAVTSGGAIGENLIINGDMRIDQRNEGASLTTTGGTMCCDRWWTWDVSNGVYSAQRSAEAPAGFFRSQSITVSTADSSIGSTEILAMMQILEGSHVAHLNWGSSDAETVTISFWINAHITGTAHVAVQNSVDAGTRSSYISSFTINSAATWEKKTITLTGQTSGTWEIGEGLEGIRLAIVFAAGSTYQTTADAWQTGLYYTTSSQTNFAGTTGTIYVTGVKLEIGSTATDFVPRDLGTEMALCQRYYEKSFSGATAATTAGCCSWRVEITGSANTYSTIHEARSMVFNTPKCKQPTMLCYSTNTGTSGRVRDASSGTEITGSSVSRVSKFGAGGIQMGTARDVNNVLQWHWTADAEL